MYRRRRLLALLVLVLIVAIVVLVVTATRGCGNGFWRRKRVGRRPARCCRRLGQAQPRGHDVDGAALLQARARRCATRSGSTEIAPKSVVSTGTGYVFAQNMMYRHTITVYDSGTLKLVKTIADSIDATTFGLKGHKGEIKGAPVEAAITPDGRFMYVSQYSMYGDGFYHEGTDACSPSSGIDKSYVYRVPLGSLRIDKAIKVGAVPKFLAVTPDQKYLLVSNWCSYTLSVVDVHTSKIVESVYLGPYPRGIAVSPDSRTAYVALMGTSNIACVDLQTFEVSWITGVGSGPRHVCIAGNGKYLYATLNAEGSVAKIDTATRTVVDKVSTGQQPRSMAIAPDGKSLYVVNYDSSTMTKVRASDMKVIQTVNTNALPIGITYDLPTKAVWVCCYTGSIMVFDDR